MQSFSFSVATVAVALTLDASGAAAQSIDYARSQVTFAGKQMNVPTEGRFKKYTAHIAFDPKKPETSKIDVEVDLGSIDTGANETDTEVKKPSWLNVAAFPTAKFVAASVKQISPGRFEASGKLSIKGIGQDVRIPFTAQTAGGATTFEGAFTLLRLQFKVGEGVWADTETVANEVQVRFKLIVNGRT
jgi:polyisoprenoid-binding protein YceI